MILFFVSIINVLVIRYYYNEGGYIILKIAGIEYQDFINFLNKELPTKETCYMVYLPAYDSIETVNGNKGFAVYENDGEYHTIYVPGNVSIPNLSKEEIENIILESIAHEYIHFIQNIYGRIISMSPKELENEAEKWALRLVDKFKSGQ